MSPSSHPASRDLVGYALGLAGVIIFGATLPMTRIAVVTFSPWFITFGRAAVAGVLAALLLAIVRRPLPDRRLWPALVLGAICTTIGFPGFSSLAMQTVPASHGGVVLGVLPLATAVAASFINGERPSPVFWFWSLAGAAIVVAFTLRAGDANFGHGDLYLLLSCVAAATGYACFAKVTRSVGGWETISFALVLMLPVSIAASALLWRDSYAAAPPEAIAAFAYVSLFSMFIGFFFWNAGLALGGVARVGQVQLLQSFVTLAISSLMLGETIRLETILFALAVVVIVMMGRRAAVTRRPAIIAAATD